jgi:chorismate dehydratase
VPLRIGIVDFLNSWPLAWGFLSGKLTEGYEVLYCSPAEVAARLGRGDIDVGLIPSIEAVRIPGLAVVPGLCVGATHEVRSVLLVSRKPVQEIRRVALDENSRTSAALVRIILADRYGIYPEVATRSPEIDEMLRDADAALVIGDPALHVDREAYEILDLAAEWRLLTGLPFVFAVWAVRPGVADQTLRGDLQASLGLAFEEMEEIIERAVAELSLGREVVERYLLRHLRFSLGREELAGLEEFYKRAQTLDLLDSEARLRFL